jgi:predicted deacetylase
MINPIKKFISDNTGILIRLDDIAENMNWELMKKCEDLFDENNIKPLLGVVPDNKDSELLTFTKDENFWNKVRAWKEKGWEIAMHGCSHTYDKETFKKDYFRYGGKSEFYGHKYSDQLSKIEKGLKKFNDEKIKIRSFFAPNHTYDQNTFRALKNFGIKNVVDGYGLIPYTNDNLNFIPQLFYKQIMLPFGIQSTQIHLNTWNEKDFDEFIIFIKKNKNYLISFDDALGKINNSFFCKVINYSSEISLKFYRLF